MFIQTFTWDPVIQKKDNIRPVPDLFQQKALSQISGRVLNTSIMYLKTATNDRYTLLQFH